MRLRGNGGCAARVFAAMVVGAALVPATSHAAITISGPATPVVEGDPGSTAGLTFSIGRSHQVFPGGDATVRFRTTGGDATPGVDHIAQDRVITVPNPPLFRQTTIDVTVPIVGDLGDEFDETVLVTIDQAAGDTITGGSATASGTIADDDAPPALTLSDGSGAEGTGAPGEVGLEVTVSVPSGKPITVPYALAPATAGSTDADLSAGTLALPPGTSGASIVVPTVADAVDELDETFTATLGTPTNASVSSGSATGTIVDDDTAVLSIGDVSATEGTGGDATPFPVPLSLSTPSDRTVSVRVTSADRSATAPADVAPLDEVVTFAPGQTARSATLAVVPDALDEADETVALTLSEPVVAVLDRREATATIVDDDDPPEVSITDGEGAEGTSEAGVVTFDVTLSDPSGRAVDVPYSVSPGTASAADVDLAGGTVEIPAGATTAVVTVATAPDAIDELNENFTVSLGTPAHAAVGRGAATGTVIDDDMATASVADLTLAEGTGTTAGDPRVTVALSTPSDRPTSVRLRSADGSALAPDDFAALDTTVAFAAGATSRTVPIAIVPDALDEVDETFTVTISEPSDLAVGDEEALVTIEDDDAPPVVSVSDATIVEGSGGPPPTASVRVTLDAPSGRPTAVRLTTADGTATAGDDYAPLNTTIAFAAGETRRDVALPIVPDTAVEPDETFTVALSAPVDLSLGRTPGTVTIANDDVPPADPDPVDPDPTPVDPDPTDPDPVDPGPQDPGTHASVPPAPAPAPPAPPAPVPAPPVASPPSAPVTATSAPRDRSRPAIRVTSLTLRRPDRVRLRVTCPKRERRCRGAVTVFTVPNRKAKRALLRRELRIGRVEFTLAGGKGRTVTTRMTKRTRTLLRSTGRLRIRAYAVARDAAGNVGLARRTATIRR